MTTASDDQIVEALAGKWSSFPFESSIASDGGSRLSPLTAAEVAEVIEPIIKAREAEAWERGMADCIDWYEPDVKDWLFSPENPYRIEAKP